MFAMCVMYVVCRDDENGTFDNMGYLLYDYTIYRNVKDAVAKADELNRTSQERYKFGGERFKVYALTPFDHMGQLLYYYQEVDDDRVQVND